MAAAAAASARANRAAFKAAVRQGKPLFGLFLNSASPLVAEQLATLDYDYMLVGPLITITPAQGLPARAGPCPAPWLCRWPPRFG